MTYERTDDIKQKQSESMKKRHQIEKYDWENIKIKRQETLNKKGIKSGRKPGDGPPKKGENKPCPVCGIDVYYTPKQIKDGKRKCCSKSCLFNDPIYKQKLKEVDRSYLQTEEYISTLIKPTTKPYRKYRNCVARLTEKCYVENMEIINPEKHPRTIAGVEGGWQLDHIKPVRQCFDEGISPEQASSVENLRMLPWRDNIMRNGKSVNKI